MPTQYGRLLKTPRKLCDAGLLSGLRSRSPSAEAEFLRLCNESRSQDEQIPAFPVGASYLDHDHRLLALLWAHAGVFPAVQALAHKSQLEVPAIPFYPELG